ncbi:hypothetical protein [Rummeliibacillus pycnus]|uniref:hypothetical protein n=1 Tax=Rummeliibacillus pycnus TaxID=101070 RepID=UPI003D2AB1A7
MEILLRKGAMYGFIIGLGIAILFVKNEVNRIIGNGVIETTYLTPFEYIIRVLRYGVIGSFIGVLVGCYLFLKQKNKLLSQSK